MGIIEIGETIRAFRELHGLSQTGLADSLNISQKKVSRLENGLTSPSLELLEKICTVLDVNPETLIVLSKKKIIAQLAQHEREEANSSLLPAYETIMKEKERYIIALEQELKHWKKKKT